MDECYDTLNKSRACSCSKRARCSSWICTTARPAAVRQQTYRSTASSTIARTPIIGIHYDAVWRLQRPRVTARHILSMLNERLFHPKSHHADPARRVTAVANCPRNRTNLPRSWAPIPRRRFVLLQRTAAPTSTPSPLPGKASPMRRCVLRSLRHWAPCCQKARTTLVQRHCWVPRNAVMQSVPR